jgi:hypothetical protein
MNRAVAETSIVFFTFGCGCMRGAKSMKNMKLFLWIIAVGFEMAVL